MVPSLEFLWPLFIRTPLPQLWTTTQTAYYHGKSALGTALSTVGFCPQLEPTLLNVGTMVHTKSSTDLYAVSQPQILTSSSSFGHGRTEPWGRTRQLQAQIKKIHFYSEIKDHHANVVGV